MLSSGGFPHKHSFYLSLWERGAVVLGLFLVVLSFWLKPAWAQALTLPVYDLQVRWKAALNPTESPVVVIKLQEALEGDWGETYAKLCVTIAQGGPAAIGLDFIPQDVRTWPGSWREVVTLPDALQPVLGCRVAVEAGESPELPADLLRTVFGERLAFLNLPSDKDRGIRAYYFGSQPLGPTELETVPSFAVRMAGRKASQDIKGLAPIDYTAGLPIIEADELWERRGDDKWLQDTFVGKYVLIGSGSPADGDQHKTPLASDTFGVEIHAHALNTLLSNFPCRNAPWTWQIGLWVGSALLGFAVTRAWCSHRYLLSSAVASFGWLLAATTTFVLLGQHFPAGPPLVTLVVVGVTGHGLWSVGVARHREALRSTFQRYVSAEVMEELLRQPLDSQSSPWESQEITVMFVDINGFSAACESCPAEQIAQMLQDYYQEMTDVLFSHGGTIMRFIGDEFLIVFGAPVSRPEPEATAVKTALAMLERLDSLKKQSDGPGFFDIKIGIHSGPMVLATIHGPGRSDYNVIGDAANVASRIQRLCKEHGVALLVSEAIWEKAKDQMNLAATPLGECSVQGRRQSVRVYSVLRRSEMGGSRDDRPKI